jgi:hypothetical protein
MVKRTRHSFEYDQRSGASITQQGLSLGLVAGRFVQRIPLR